MRAERLAALFRVSSLLLLSAAISAGTIDVPLSLDLPLSGQDLFGYGVAVSGDTAVVGARGHDESAFGAGAAYVYPALTGRSWTDLGFALEGVAGPPALVGTGTLAAGQVAALELTSAAPGASCALLGSFASTSSPFNGGTQVPVPSIPENVLTTDGVGTVNLPLVWPAGVPPGTAFYEKYTIADAAAVHGIALSNAL